MRLSRKIRQFAWQASMTGLRRGPHVTRYYMYNWLQKLGQDLQLKPGRVLSVSHSDKLASLLGIQANEIVSADYPEHNFLSLNFPDSSFDYVISDQVLEHVEGDPYKAVSECHRILRPGGISVLTTCFINPIHACPKDSGVLLQMPYRSCIKTGQKLSRLAAGEILPPGPSFKTA
jgi:ubiquinone/menaquinone biosynthesis C-methylase UbiE